VQIYPDTVLHAVVPVEQTDALTDIDAAESARRLAALGIRVPGEDASHDDDTWTRPIDLVGAPS